MSSKKRSLLQSHAVKWNGAVLRAIASSQSAHAQHLLKMTPPHNTWIF